MELSDRGRIAVILCLAAVMCFGIARCRKTSDPGNDRIGTSNTVQSAAEDDFEAINWNSAKTFTDSASLEAYLQQCYNEGMQEIKVISVDKPPGSGMFKGSTGMLRTSVRSWKVGNSSFGRVYYAVYNVQYAMSIRILDAAASGDTTGLTDQELKVYAKAKEFVDSLSPGLSDYNKEKAIHDYICKLTTYYSDETTGSEAYFRTAEGVFMYGYANCMGYSDAFLLLCRLAGLEVETDISNEISHMWNVITLDGNKYLVDVTWDDMEGDKYNHQYFNAGKDKAQDHCIAEGSLSEQIVEYSDKFYGGA